MKITMQILESQIPKELSGEKNKKDLKKMAKHLHLLSEDDIKKHIPFCLLCDLVPTCKELNLKKNYHKVLTNMQMMIQKISKQIPKELSGRMTRDSLERIANHLHLATGNDMGEIPLWLLEDLAITCKELNLKKNYHKVLIELQKNLEAKQRLKKAERRLKKDILLIQQVTNFTNKLIKKYTDTINEPRNNTEIKRKETENELEQTHKLLTYKLRNLNELAN